MQTNSSAVILTADTTAAAADAACLQVEIAERARQRSLLAQQKSQDQEEEDEQLSDEESLPDKESSEQARYAFVEEITYRLRKE